MSFLGPRSLAAYYRSVQNPCCWNSMAGLLGRLSSLRLWPCLLAQRSAQMELRDVDCRQLVRTLVEGWKHHGIRQQAGHRTVQKRYSTLNRRKLQSIFTFLHVIAVHLIVLPSLLLHHLIFAVLILLTP